MANSPMLSSAATPPYDSGILRRGLIGIAVAMVVATFLILLFIFKLPTESVATAVLALFGALFTASVTAVGLLLKDSLDRRAAILQREAELRLKAETSLKAIELMTAKGLSHEAASERREAAIVALGSLGYHTSILILCERYWKEGGISSDLLMHVFDDCLKSNDERLQIRAASLLVENAEKLPEDPDELAFPPSLYLAWHRGIHSSAKFSVLNALAKAMMSKDFDYWQDSTRNQFLYSFFKMFTIDDEDRFRLSAALYALRLCERQVESGSCLEDETFAPPDRAGISYREIKEAALTTLGYEVMQLFPADEELREKLAARVTVSVFAQGCKIAKWDEGSIGN